MFGRNAKIYAVECVHCQETLLTTAQIGDAEARIVADIWRPGTPQCSARRLTSTTPAWRNYSTTSG